MGESIDDKIIESVDKLKTLVEIIAYKCTNAKCDNCKESLSGTCTFNLFLDFCEMLTKSRKGEYAKKRFAELSYKHEDDNLENMDYSRKIELIACIIDPEKTLKKIEYEDCFNKVNVKYYTGDDE